MFRTLWFQLHWFFGITAGIVLVLVGVTGGLLSFESEILRALNPGVLTVTPAGERLPPAELLERVLQAVPERRINAITLHSSAHDAAQVNLASPDPADRRGETRYVDPYSGELLGAARGVEFFRATMRLHRWLMFDDAFDNRELGKHIVGASTVLLILLCLTGVYLRWPRKATCWRTWLTFSLARKGRGFVWDLHAVLGTWVLLLYLLASVTGLYWSYEWYRNFLHSASGVPRPVMPGTAPAPNLAGSPATARKTVETAALAPGERGRRDAGGDRSRTAAGSPTEMPAVRAALSTVGTVDAGWTIFQSVVNSYSRVAIRLPQAPGQEMTFIYLEASPPHERASNRLVVDPANGTPLSHERYADKPLKARLIGSMLPLHSGSYFGATGKVLMMVASLAMPIFTVTGWMLYLERRRRKKATRMAIAAAGASGSAPAGQGLPLLIAYASQSGTAESLAWQSAELLRKNGRPVTVKSLGEIPPAGLTDYSHALFVVSTFGDGEPPVNALAFVREMKEQDLSALNYGLLSLGDRQYEHFCSFGRAVDDWLRRCGASELFAPVEVDNGNADALAQWRRHLVAI